MGKLRRRSGLGKGNSVPWRIMLNTSLGPRHPLLTWCAWWSAALLHRVQVRPNGRTAYEMYTGHRFKTPIAAFGEKIMWRKSRAVSGKRQVRPSGVIVHFVGVSGSEVMIAIENSIQRSRDIRRVADRDCWSKSVFDKCSTTFEQYLHPSLTPDESL